MTSNEMRAKYTRVGIIWRALGVFQALKKKAASSQPIDDKHESV